MRAVLGVPPVQVKVSPGVSCPLALSSANAMMAQNNTAASKRTTLNPQARTGRLRFGLTSLRSWQKKTGVGVEEYD